MDFFGAGGDEHELGAPRGFAGAFEMQARVEVRRVSGGSHRLCVGAGVVGFGAVERRDDFAVGVEHPVEMRWVHEPVPFGLQSPSSAACWAASSRWSHFSRVEELPGVSRHCPRVEVVMSSHRRRRQRASSGHR